MQFTGTQVLVQHLMTSTLLTMPAVTLNHAQTLAALTLFQVEYKTSTQSWPELFTSHLMRWRCFTWIDLPLPPFIHVLNSFVI